MYVNCVIIITIVVNSKSAVKCFCGKEISDTCLQLHIIVTIIKCAVRVTEIAAVYLYAHISMLGNAAASLGRLSDNGFAKVLCVAADFLSRPFFSSNVLDKLEYNLEVVHILNCDLISINDAHWLRYIHELIPFNKRFKRWKSDSKSA